jgi:hypothetical protein
MVHLAIHLPKEAMLRGPVQYGWMYPIERRLSVEWIPGYPGPPATGPHHRPIFSSKERINNPSYGEDPHEEAPREENDDGNH